MKDSRFYALLTMTVCGLGGLLYGIDLGIIAAALPYVKASATYTDAQLSRLVAAVILGALPGTLLSAPLADRLGRKRTILIGALLFVLSVPAICLSGGSYALFYAGRIMQGVASGIIVIATPMYLAECLEASQRGKGTGVFQLVLTIGLVLAAAIGLAVAAMTGAADSAEVTQAAKRLAWQAIFWSSELPAVAFLIGVFFLKESPCWLENRGRRRERSGRSDSLLSRRYVVPFVISFVVLVCTQATGINSVLNYSVMIFDKAGLSGIGANWADIAIKAANLVFTVVACVLVDRKGRKFLLKLGTAGVFVGLAFAGGVFWALESGRIVPGPLSGCLVASAFVLFVSFYAVGPGVCVWLAMSELMPTRIRASGMMIGALANQAVSYAIAGSFLPWSAAWGCHGVFFTLSVSTFVYFLVAAFVLPETRGKTLEEIEAMFMKGESC